MRTITTKQYNQTLPLWQAEKQCKADKKALKAQRDQRKSKRNQWQVFEG